MTITTNALSILAVNALCSSDPNRITHPDSSLGKSMISRGLLLKSGKPSAFGRQIGNMVRRSDTLESGMEVILQASLALVDEDRFVEVFEGG